MPEENVGLEVIVVEEEVDEAEAEGSGHLFAKTTEKIERSNQVNISHLRKNIENFSGFEAMKISNSSS